MVRTSQSRQGTHLGKLASIAVTHYCIGDTQPMQIPHHTTQPLSIAVIGQDHPCILHKLSCQKAKHISKGLKISYAFTQTPFPEFSPIPFPPTQISSKSIPLLSLPPWLQGGTYVAGFATRGTAHIQDALILLWSQSHNREETGSSLQHVVSSQVFRGGTCAGMAKQREKKHINKQMK